MMSKTFWLGALLAVLGFAVGCGSEMAQEPPPGGPSMESLNDASAYALPEEQPK